MQTLEDTRRTPLAEQGQTLAEYAILAGGIAVTVALTLPLIGRAVAGLFESAARAFGG